MSNDLRNTSLLTRRRLVLSALTAVGSSSVLGVLTIGCGGGGKTPIPGPAPTPTPGVSPSPTPSPAVSPSPTPSPSPGASRVERLGYIERGSGSDAYIASIRIDGSDYRRVPMPGQPGITHMDWSRDGKRIAFQVEEAVRTNQNPQIFVVNADGTGLRFLLRGWYPKWHADSRRLAYVLNDRATPGDYPYSVVDAIDVDGDIGASVLETRPPSYIIFFAGSASSGSFQYTRPQWISDTSNDIYVSMAAFLGNGSSKTGVERYSDGQYAVEGLTGTDGLGEVVGLGLVSPDGSFTYGRTRFKEVLWEREERSYLVQNGTTTDLATVPWGRIMMFSPDAKRVLFNAVGTPFSGTGIYDFHTKEITQIPLSLTQIVYSWFYE